MTVAEVGGSWDLRANSSPRSLCAFTAPPPPPPSASAPSSGTGTTGSTSTNPFESPPAAAKGAGGAAAAAFRVSPPHAIVFGTERGALHFRTYDSKSSSSSLLSSSSSRGNDEPQGRGGGGGNTMVLQAPLGSRGSGGGGDSSLASSAMSVPTMYQLVDLNGAVPGAIVGVIRAWPNANASGSSGAVQPIFLLLVDDNRGSSSSSSSPGAFAAHMVTLRHGTFVRLASAPAPSAASRSGLPPSGRGMDPPGTVASSSAATSVVSLPRMSCAAYHPAAGFVYASGTTVRSLPANAQRSVVAGLVEDAAAAGRPPASFTSSALVTPPCVTFSGRGGGGCLLPSPGARSGQDALTLACQGRIAVVAVGNSFYAVASIPLPTVVAAAADHADLDDAEAPPQQPEEPTRLLAFSQSSQVHPVLCVEIPIPTASSSPRKEAAAAASMEPPQSCALFLGSGRECAVVEVRYDARARPSTAAASDRGGVLSASTPRHGIATLASPILAAAVAANAGVAILTSDGLVQIRSPSCITVPLSTVEVGSRPNDFFVLRPLPRRRLVAISFSGEGRVVTCRPDTTQDFSDRLMRLAIEAFGSTGFPRTELAEALHASFSAASYVGSEVTPKTRLLLRQYLEVILGLHSADLGGVSEDWQDDEEEDAAEADEDKNGDAGRQGDWNTGNEDYGRLSGSPASSPSSMVCCTALLGLVCLQLSPPAASLANRAAKTCASRMGVAGDASRCGIVPPAVVLCEQVAHRLVNASHHFSLSPSPHRGRRAGASANNMEFVEAAVWLLRACQQHERAMEVLQERRHSAGGQRPPSSDEEASGSGSGSSGWSQLKYESYTAAHLGELWASGSDDCAHLVLESEATRQLLEQNPALGLSVFTAPHPHNERQWREGEDPLAKNARYPKVVELLKSVNPAIVYDATSWSNTGGEATPPQPSSLIPSPESAASPLPLESGRALAVTFLESAIGISTHRPVDPLEEEGLASAGEHNKKKEKNVLEERIADMHDELSYLLLEGIIAERGDDPTDEDSALGALYRDKLRRFLSWPNTKIRAPRLLSSLPPSFLREQALVLGRLGRHEDALRILYGDLDSLEMALEYCDARYEARRLQLERGGGRGGGGGGSSSDRLECCYVPLVKVALQQSQPQDPNASASSSDRGVKAAIQVLALRRGKIDRGAALRLLPQNVPMSAVARPFLIPALVDSESQVRRLTVTASLLRAKYMALQRSLTHAQLSSQEYIKFVPALRALHLGGEPLYSSKPFRARPTHTASSTFPQVMLTKHFFPRYLVIQAQVVNNAPSVEGRALADVSFVVAESSDDALLPTGVQVPVPTLPWRATGSSWCVLSASPQRLEGTTAIMTCELRYTVLNANDAAAAAAGIGGSTRIMGRAHVEELQDLQVRSMEFDP